MNGERSAWVCYRSRATQGQLWEVQRLGRAKGRGCSFNVASPVYVSDASGAIRLNSWVRRLAQLGFLCDPVD